MARLLAVLRIVWPAGLGMLGNAVMRRTPRYRLPASALLAGFMLVAWIGTAHAQSAPSADPALLTDITAITTGGAHTCAVTSSGNVQCWGANEHGQLGNGSTRSSLTPVDVRQLNATVIAIDAGTEHTCVVTSEGGVKCWGSNEYGQLGDGTQERRLTPVDVQGLPGSVTHIAAGSGHTCALTGSGSVLCWGRNDIGQLGDGTNEPRLAPVGVSGLQNGVVAMDLVGHHTCALTDSGGVLCWGRNSHGQLGDDTLESRSTPVEVTGLANGITAIAVGGYHVCAATNGSVWCWGWNGSGQLGDGGGGEPCGNEGKDICRLTPVEVVGPMSSVTAISAGWVHTCTLAAGGVQCWGNNENGQLGDDSTTARLTPVNVIGLSGVTAIDARTNVTCALTSGGGVKCWGWNNRGQLGDGTTETRRTPVDVVAGKEDTGTVFLPIVHQ